MVLSPARLSDVKLISTSTQAGLLSGTSWRERADDATRACWRLDGPGSPVQGLLTTVLSPSPQYETRMQLFAALRWRSTTVLARHVLV